MNIMKSHVLVQAIVSVVLGLLLWFQPSMTINGIIVLFGAAFAVLGLIALAGYFIKKTKHYRNSGTLTGAIVCLLIALITFVFPAAIASVFSVIVGLILILCGALNIARSLELKRFADRTWIPSLVTSAIIAIGGVIVVVNPFDSLVFFVGTLGAFLIVNGACNFFIYWRMRDDGTN